MKLPRPQPIGLFPQPASFLLVPAGLSEAQIAALMAGKLPQPLPPTLEFFALAAQGEIPAALAALSGDDPISRVNRFVLTREAELHARLAAETEGEMRAVLALAASAFNLPNVDPPAPATLDGELRAAALGALARRQRNEGREAEAFTTLAEAGQAARDASPLLAAQLIASRANWVLQLQGFGPEMRTLYNEAIALLEPIPACAEFRAALCLSYAQLCQRYAEGHRKHVAEAVRNFQDALRTFRRESHPEAYAEAQTGLALCYLSLPMREASDQLRMGIAVQALRDALTVYTREAHPTEWASTRLNLANALVYLPSTHPRENLAQAIKLYDEVLEVRTAADDPLGHARALTNQANALAHAGALPQAQANLDAALALFREAGDQDGMQTVFELLQQIEAQEGVKPA